MKSRWIGVYLTIFAYGVLMWSVSDDLNRRPAWAQWTGTAFWAAIAFVFVWIFAKDD